MPHSTRPFTRAVSSERRYCPYCKKAKAALSTLLTPEQFFVIEVRLLHRGASSWPSSNQQGAWCGANCLRSCL